MRCWAQKSAVVFSVDEWDETFARVQSQIGRIQLAIPEWFEELDALQTEAAPGTGTGYPFVLSADERRSYTANTILGRPDWRKRDRAGALRINPDDAQHAEAKSCRRRCQARRRLLDSGRSRDAATTARTPP